MNKKQIYLFGLANRAQLLSHLTLRTFSVGSEMGGERLRQKNANPTRHKNKSFVRKVHVHPTPTPPLKWVP